MYVKITSQKSRTSKKNGIAKRKKNTKKENFTIPLLKYVNNPTKNYIVFFDPSKRINYSHFPESSGKKFTKTENFFLIEVLLFLVGEEELSIQISRRLRVAEKNEFPYKKINVVFLYGK